MPKKLPFIGVKYHAKKSEKKGKINNELQKRKLIQNGCLHLKLMNDFLIVSKFPSVKKRRSSDDHSCFVLFKAEINKLSHKSNCLCVKNSAKKPRWRISAFLSLQEGCTSNLKIKEKLLKKMPWNGLMFVSANCILND